MSLTKYSAAVAFLAGILWCAGAGDARAAAMSQAAAAPAASNPSAQPTAPTTAATESPKRVTAYTLPPDIYAKARDLSRIGHIIDFVEPLYLIAVLVLFLRWGWSVKFRTWAEAASSRRIVQATIYAAVLLFVFALFDFPFRIYGHHLARTYDLSIQGWDSWLWDQAKGQLVTTVIGALAIWILFAVVQRSPRRWWFYFWLMSLPLATFLIFLAPLVIDPLFNKFEPLAGHDAPLAASLERVVNRAELSIPVERMFWMKASEKVKELNAYVTGLGASKRIVVWDTTIAKMTGPQIDTVFGHEMGHYVLGHVYKGLLFAAATFFIFFYLAYRISIGVIARRGQGWHVRGPGDFAALPLYMAILFAILFVATPVNNAFSRYQEHQADQYGLEVTHGLLPDSGQTMAQAFQVLGEVDLEDPAPTRLEIWWYWDHPWIGDRIKFALAYDPWSKGGSGEFVK